MQTGAPGGGHMKSTWEAMSQLAALHRTRGPFMQGRGCPGAPRGSGHLSVPKRGFISSSLRWKGASWPVPAPLPPKVTDEQSLTEDWSWRHEQLGDVQGRVSRSEIRLESGSCGVLGRSVDSDGDNAALLGRARSLLRWPRPGGQHGSGGR